VCRAPARPSVGWILACGLIFTAELPAAVPPYPHSELITAASWDLSAVRALRKAQGSDLWPLAWAADGNLYGAWGDGGGFEGNDLIGRVSLGWARITGTPVIGENASYSGTNVWGDAPQYAQNRATFGGKIDDLFSLGGVLYGHGGLWTKANCGCPDPTRKSGANLSQHNLVWSEDLGRSWQIASWSAASDPGSSLQYGRDYAGAKDPAHVYFYYQRDVNRDPGHIYLRRVASNQLLINPDSPGHYEYLSAFDAGVPVWSTTAAAAIPVFDDPAVPTGVYSGASVVYDRGLDRYLLATMHGDQTGQMGFFEAPTPWGPWATVAYYDDWGGFNESAGSGNGLQFPSKWISPDGTTLWAVFSGVDNGFDSFNVAKLTLSTRVPTSSLAGRWDFDEGAGHIAHDSSGFGHSGRLLNGVEWTHGRRGTALDFHEGREAVLVGAAGNLANLHRRGLTVMAWIKPRSEGVSGRIVDKDGNDVGWFLKLTGTGLQFVADQFKQAPLLRNSATPLSLDMWQQIAVTWDGSSSGAGAHLYINGTASDGSFVDGVGEVGDDSATALTIGNRYPGLDRGFDGLIQDVRVFDHALSAADLSRDYLASSKTRGPPSPP